MVFASFMQIRFDVFSPYASTTCGTGFCDSFYGFIVFVRCPNRRSFEMDRMREGLLLHKLRNFDIPMRNIIRFLTPLERCYLIVPDERGLHQSKENFVSPQRRWNRKIREMISDLTKKEDFLLLGDVIPSHDSSTCGRIHSSGLSINDFGAFLHEFFPNVSGVEFNGWTQGTFNCHFHNSVPTYYQVSL